LVRRVGKKKEEGMSERVDWTTLKYDFGRLKTAPDPIFRRVS
jgi:hypothetical protein